MVAAGALLLYVSASFWFVLLAQLMHGLTAGLITPAKAAIGLGLVGHRGLYAGSVAGVLRRSKRTQV